MQNHPRRKAIAKTARIDRRPALIATAISVLASLLVAAQLFL